MIVRDEIIAKLKGLTNHGFIELTTRGNTAIEVIASLIGSNVGGSNTDGGKKILIPEEGGWLSYRKLPNVEYVRCDDAKINLKDLESILKTKNVGLFLYQNPGGYFAEQPMKEIYNLCRKHRCICVIDVSGSIGTDLCDGKYADVLVCSFGKWKLVEAHVGGFISCKDKELFGRLNFDDDSLLLKDEGSFRIISDQIKRLKDRISFLKDKINIIKEDLGEFNLVHAEDEGFVVVVKFDTESEREKIINYCKDNHLEWTECPRYIRLNKKAISIEVKRLLK